MSRIEDYVERVIKDLLQVPDKFYIVHQRERQDVHYRCEATMVWSARSCNLTLESAAQFVLERFKAVGQNQRHRYDAQTGWEMRMKHDPRWPNMHIPCTTHLHDESYGACEIGWMIQVVKFGQDLKTDEWVEGVPYCFLGFTGGRWMDVGLALNVCTKVADEDEECGSKLGFMDDTEWLRIYNQATSEVSNDAAAEVKKLCDELNDGLMMRQYRQTIRKGLSGPYNPC